MGLIDAIRKLGQNKSETKKKFKQLQEDDRLQNMLEERKKSSNRRELEKYIRDQEEMKIKQELDKIHKMQSSESWKGSNVLGQKTTILKDDRPILMEKNIFLDNKTNNPLGGKMFFRW